MSDELILRLAVAMPDGSDSLSRVKGMTPYMMQKFGHGILKALDRGRKAPPILEDPRPPRVHRDTREWKVFEELRQWRKAQADSEGVDPVVIMSSDNLRDIARRTIENGGDPLRGLSTLKRNRYGQQLSKMLEQHTH